MSNLQTTLISGDVYIQSSLDVGVYGPGNLNIDGILTCSSIAGTWTGSTILVAQGGTGLTTLNLNSVLLGNGTSNIQTPSNFTFDGVSVSLPKIISTNTTDSISISTGAVTLAGGLGITKSVYIGNNLNISGNINSGTWNASTISVSKGGTGVTTSTGSGSVVLSTSPTLITPVLGSATGTSISVTGNINSLTTTITGSTSGVITIQAQANAGTYNFNLPITVGTAGQVLTSQGGSATAMTWTTPSTGTVTSVALTVPSFLSVSGSPITSSGTLAVSLSGTALPVLNGGTGVTTSTGSGSVVLSTSPTLVTPVIGAATGTSVSVTGNINSLTTTITGSTSGVITIQAQANAGTYNFNLPITVGTAGQVLTSQGGSATAMTWTTPSTGTVTSVALTVPSFLSVSGSPITSSGTLAVTLSGTALPVLNGGTGVTTSTGSGSVVLSTSPTLVTPVIGAATGTSLQLSGLTISQAVATDASKNLISVSTTGTGNYVLATSPTLVTPVLGAATGISLQLSGLTVSQAVATDASKNLISVATTGTGNYVLATSPTLVTPVLGAATGTSISVTGNINSLTKTITGSTSGVITIQAQVNAGTYNFNLPITSGTSGQVLTSQGGASSAMTWTTLSTGTVTSVALTVPSFLSVSGSPITSSGTLAVSLSGTALPVLNGGTGVTTSTGSGSVVLSTSPTLVTPVLGAATGTSLQLSGLTALQVVATDASKNLISVATTGTGNYVLATSPTLVTPVLGAATGTSVSVTGNINSLTTTITGSTSGVITIQAQAAAGTYNFNLPITVGTAGQVLTSQGGSATAMTWTTPSTGTVTSVALTVPSFLSISGSPITSSGTLAVTLSGTALPVLNGGTGVTTSTGSGNNVLSTSPTLVTPILGAATGTSLQLSGLTASQAVATDTSKNLISVATTGTGNYVLATSPTLVTPILGAATGTSLQLSGLIASQTVATDASKNLISVATTGTGNYVLATSPTLVTPVIGAATGTSVSVIGNINSLTSSITGSTSGVITIQAQATAGTYNFNLPITVGSAGQVLTSQGGASSAMTWTTLTTGTVTSVALTVPSFLSISGSPITTSGTLAVTLSGTALPVLNGGTGVTSSTGSGSVVLSTSPTLVTPILGAATGTSLQLSGLTASQAVATDSSKNLISVATTGTGIFVLASTPIISNINANSTKITNVADPVSSSDAATKNYVDLAVQGLSTKASVVAATTTSGTLASSFANGNIIDGVTLATGNRILIKDQSTQTQNGIYTVNSTGSPTRATDLNTGASAAGIYVFVEQGTVNADSGWVCTTDLGSDIVGTNNLVFAQFSGAGQIIAGTGLTKLGNTLSVNASQTQITAIGTITTGTWNAITIAVANGGTGVTTSTGSGSVVLSTSPTLVTPVLGSATGTSISVTGNINSLTSSITGSISGVITIQAQANAGTYNFNLPITVGTAGQVLTSQGGTSSAMTWTTPVTSVALTVPSFLSVSGSPITTSGTLAVTLSGTALPVLNGGTGVTTSTGSGSVVLSTSPTLITPVLGSATGTSISVTGNVNSLTSSITGSTSGIITVQAQANAGTYNFNLPITVGTAGQVLTSQGGSGTAMTWTTLSTGTVTSVALTVPSFLSVSGSPITTSGTLAVTLSGTALPVLNGGTGVTTSTGSGSNVLSTSPTLVTPVLGSATGTSISVTGNVNSLTSSITGSTSGVITIQAQANAGTYNFNLPITVGTAGQVLTSQGGSGSAMTWTTPVTSVALTVPSFLSISGSPITSSGTLAVTLSGTALPVLNGGTGVTTSTGSGSVVLSTSPTLVTPVLGSATGTSLSVTGNVNSLTSSITGSTSGVITVQAQANAGTYNFNLPITVGTAGQVLTSQGGASSAMTWTTPVTSVALTVPSFLSISGSPITSSGTLVVTLSGTALPVLNGGTGVTTSTGSGSNVLSTSPTLITPVLGSATGTSLSVTGNVNSLTSSITGSTSGIITVQAQANAGTYNFNLPITVGTAGQVLTSQGGSGSAMTWTTLSTGTVTSVALTVPSFLSVSGSPITSSGTLAVTLSGTALPVLNGGTGVTTSTGSGSNVLSTSPTLVTPVLGSATGTSVSVTGNINSLTSSITGSTSGIITVQAQANAGTYNFNLPTTAGTAGQVLTSQGGGSTATTWSTAGTGTVTSVALTVPSFLSVSGSPITTSGTLAVSLSGTALPVLNGGIGVTTLTSNAVLLGNGTTAIQSPSSITYSVNTLTLPMIISNDTTTTTSSSTGSITIAGGIGISNTTDAVSTSDGGTFTTAGGMAIAKKLYMGDGIFMPTGGSNLGITLNTNSQVYSTGIATASTLVLTSNGGHGIIIASTSGNCAFDSTTASTSNTTGAITLAGGIGISNTTDATSSTNGGTFTTAGGIAIAKSVYIGTSLIQTAITAPVNPSAGDFKYYTDSADTLLKSKNSSGTITTYQPITTKGDLVSHNGTTQTRLPIGTDGTVLTADSTQTLGVKWGTMSGGIMFYIRDEKTSGTNGGTATSGSFQTRTLNTITAYPSGNTRVTLSANIMTFTAGTYYIVTSAPALAVTSHTSRLFNTGASTVLATGTSVFNSGAASSGITTIAAILTFASSTTVSLQHQVQTTSLNTGFGDPSGFQTETYSTVIVTVIV